jgi:hypothetical protein
MLVRSPRAWNPARRKRRVVWVLVACGLALGACGSNSGIGTPGTPAPTSVTVPVVVPSTTPTFVQPPSLTRTSAILAEREVVVNQPVEADYPPGERFVFYNDQARRVGIVLEAVDGGGPVQLKARIYDEDDTLLPPAMAAVGQPLLREEWDLPEPGWYSIQVFGPEITPRTFMLTVVPRPTPDMGGGEIAYGETRSGEITIRGQRDRWVFQGRAGDRVLITMIAPGADAYLELYGPNAQLIARNDDSSQFGTSPALETTLPADGEYAIVARMYEDDQVGSYRLALERTGNP